MASIENKSRFVVTVQHCDDLIKTFAHSRERDLKTYVAQLKAEGYKPKLSRTNDNYIVRVRGAGRTKQCLPARSEQEAIDIKQRIELERRNGLFVDYSKGRCVIQLLRQLPQTTEAVFPMSIDAVRKAWWRICEAAKLVGDDELRIHDLRHEASSRIADAGGKLPGGFSLADLQALSGHRDTRMLLRYTHLCMPSLAKRLDLAFADKVQTVIHRGQRRLKKGASLTMKELVDGTAASGATAATSPAQSQQEAEPVGQEQPTNVVPFRPRKVA